MSNIIVRRNRQFCIDKSQLSEAANKTHIHNALLGAIYTEFIGASTNPVYSNLTPLDRFNKVNEFAQNWLKERGLQ